MSAALEHAVAAHEGHAAPAWPDPTQSLAPETFERVADTFFRRAAAHPRAVAVSHGAGEWTYERLAARARGIAGEIDAAGLGRHHVVAVTGRRSPDLVAAIVGVLASRAVLLTLDPALPLARRRLMLEDTGAVLVLEASRSDASGHLAAEQIGVPVVRLDAEGRDEGDLQELPADDRALAGGDDAAYIFFTSGSTGRPKAILGSHNGLAHFLDWQRRTFAVGPGDRCAQLTGLSFDVVLRDVLLPLTSGATLCLPADGEGQESGEALSWLDRAQITLLHAVPSLVASWLGETNRPEELSTLRWVFFAGEPLTAGLIGRWRALCPGAEVANLYGPTETTLATCSFVVPDPAPPGVQPVGRPLPGSQALVMAADGRLCAPGEEGEIVIRSPYRSHGYLNAIAERERFARNPFLVGDDAVDTDVIYRTGDRGRHDDRGLLEILGRVDDEIKIRGVRIAPAEVAAALAAHDAVRHAVAVGERRDSGDVILTAYVVPADHQRAAASTLRAHLADRLPAAMIPTRFVFLDRLPLTPNGKVDRAALAGLSQAAIPEDDQPPRTPIELVLSGIWAELLRQPRMGIHANFFDVGGHSLLATRLLGRIAATLRVTLPLRTLFDHPTIALLAEAMVERPDGARTERVARILTEVDGPESDRAIPAAATGGME